jgi:hypothetical protein
MVGLGFIVAASYGASCDSGAGTDDEAQGRIDIAPSPLVQRPLGGTVQFTARAFDGAGNAMVPQPTFSWASGNRVAAVAPTGAATAVATVQNCGAGSADCGTCSRITATAGDVVGETFIALEGSTAQWPCPPR